MKLLYKLIGLDCANCAAKIEKKINKLSHVESASLNFMTTKLNLEITDDFFEETNNEIISIIKKIEPDVIVQRV